MNDNNRSYHVVNGIARVLPYPGQQEDTNYVASKELQHAEIAMYASKLQAVAARVKMRVAAGYQPSRDEVAQVTRYAHLMIAAGVPRSKLNIPDFA